MILMYCCVLAAMAAILVVGKITQQTRQRKRIKWVTQWLQQLRGLLEIFPKHRGMANALLKGDDSFRPAMEKLQREADDRLLSMRQLVVKRGDWSEQQLLNPITQQWQMIKENVFSMPANKSFALHTQLIAVVIERMEDDSLELAAFAHNSFSLDQDYLKSLVIMLTRELPHVVESIGQARGIGTGVAAQRRSTVANRVNLKYLHGNTLSIIQNKLVPLRLVLHQHHDMKEQAMEECIDSAVLSAQKFLNLLQSELIDTVNPTVSPEAYYQQGTAAIDAGFRLFDKLFPRCTQLLGLR
ncbi:MAG: hypothetical protein AMJ53_01055 [Gammaproteobacteria bacterium SG8_11]|nr:MAG: hypothetical protein AMJ53_01055 [Gammaproteobacteria bacterium SG8_11]